MRGFARQFAFLVRAAKGEKGAQKKMGTQPLDHGTQQKTVAAQPINDAAFGKSTVTMQVV